MLPLYAIEDNMPFLSNFISASKAKRRSRKIYKHYSIHSGVSDWTDWVVTSSVDSDNLVITAPGSRGGNIVQDITVVSGIRYRYSIMVIGSTGGGSKTVKLGTPLDNDAFKTHIITSLENEVANGIFTTNSTTLRLTLEVQSANATLTLGKILIEEA